MRCAALDGTKRSRETTPFTCSRVCGVTWAWPFSVRDTVATETPAALATSRIVVTIARRGQSSPSSAAPFDAITRA